VLYIETDRERFEISKIPGNMSEGGIKYRFSLVKEPMFKDNSFYNSVKRPLEEQYINVISKDLDWTDFIWGEKSVIVKD
jgi:hypothetical protein